MLNRILAIPGQDRIDGSAVFPKTSSDGGYLLARLFFEMPELTARVYGSIAGIATAAGTITGRVSLTSSSAGAATVSTVISGRGKVTAAADGVATVSSAVSARTSLTSAAAGSANAAAVIAGYLKANIQAAGVAAAAASVYSWGSVKVSATGQGTAAVIAYVITEGPNDAPEVVLLISPVQLTYSTRSLVKQSVTVTYSSAVQVQHITDSTVQRVAAKASPVQTLFTAKSVIK